MLCRYLHNIDHGSVFVSANFRDSCRHLGISIQPAHLATGSDKPHIEKMFSSLGTLFCQFAAGYLGRSADRRGRHVDDQPLWSLMQMQDLLDEWLIAVWQNRAHDGLRDPLHPQRAFSPDQKYAALIETAGYVPVPLSGEDHIELLPATWRAVNAYGVMISHRTYDAAELNPIRQQKSGVAARKGLWEVRRDPYDVSRVFVRGPGGWITCPWKYLGQVPFPFGELAWDHVSGRLAEQGRGDASELERAQAVDDLLRRAYHGPPGDPETEDAGTVRPRRRPSARDRRVAARTARRSPLQGICPAGRCPARQPGGRPGDRRSKTAASRSPRSSRWESSTPTRKRRNAGERAPPPPPATRTTSPGTGSSPSWPAGGGSSGRRRRPRRNCCPTGNGAGSAAPGGSPTTRPGSTTTPAC